MKCEWLAVAILVTMIMTALFVHACDREAVAESKRIVERTNNTITFNNNK